MPSDAQAAAWLAWVEKEEAELVRTKAKVT
jgi:hypothetical protein